MSLFVVHVCLGLEPVNKTCICVCMYVCMFIENVTFIPKSLFVEPLSCHCLESENYKALYILP